MKYGVFFLLVQKFKPYIHARLLGVENAQTRDTLPKTSDIGKLLSVTGMTLHGKIYIGTQCMCGEWASISEQMSPVPGISKPSIKRLFDAHSQEL